MITEHQYRRLMKEYQQSGQIGRAALKASMDRKTAARYLAARHGPEVKQPRWWRTRSDPLAAVRPLRDALPQHDQSDTVLSHLLDLDPRDFGGRPGSIVVPAERAHRCTQRRGHDVAQPALLQLGDHSVGPEAAVPAHQRDGHLFRQTGKSVVVGPRGQIPQGPAVQAGERFARAPTAAGKKTRERRLAGDCYDAQRFGHGRVMRQVRHPRQLIGPAQDAADETQRRFARIVGVGTGRCVRQHRAQLFPQPLLRDILGPHRQLAVRREALVPKTNPYRLHPFMVPKSSRTVWIAVEATALVVVSITTSTTPNGAPLGDYVFSCMIPA